MFCPQCGQPVAREAKYCPACGHGLTGMAPATAMGGAAVETPSATAAQVAATAAIRYGGFWRRFWAAFLDGFVLCVVLLPVNLILLPSTMRWPSEELEGDQFTGLIVAYMVQWVIGTLVTWLYAALLMSSSRRATLGQMALGLRVNDLEGRRISFLRATGRHLASVLSTLTLLIGYLVMLFNDRRQTLHDMLASTVVVRS